MNRRNYDYNLPGARAGLRRMRQQRRLLLWTLWFVGGGVITWLIHLCLTK